MNRNRDQNAEADLARRISALEDQVRSLPARPVPSPCPHIDTIIILRGNTVLASDTYYGTIYGCKVPASGITAVPSATPGSGGLGTYTDGLCAGSLYDGRNYTIVWVAIKVHPDAVDISDTVGTLIEGMIIQSRYSHKLPITGGGGALATVHLPWYVG